MISYFLWKVNPSSTVLNVLDAKVCITKNWLLFKCESHVRDFECIVNKTAGGRSQAQILSDFTFVELSWHLITKISFSRHGPNSFEMLHSFNFTIYLPCKKLKCHLEETVILSCSFTWANKCNEYEHIQMWTQPIRLLKGRKSFKEIVQVFLKSGPLYEETFIRGNLYMRKGSYRSKLGSKFSMLVISLCKVRNTVIRGF